MLQYYLMFTFLNYQMMVAQDPCLDGNFNEIDNVAKRSPSYDQVFTACDKDLIEGWYGAKAHVMSTSPPELYKCGTVYPVWLRGRLARKLNYLYQRLSQKQKQNSKHFCNISLNFFFYKLCYTNIFIFIKLKVYKESMPNEDSFKLPNIVITYFYTTFIVQTLLPLMESPRL